jgi:hypothetical protein
MGVMDDSVGWESYDHKGDSYQKHCIKVVTKLSGCCIDENRSDEHDIEHILLEDVVIKGQPVRSREDLRLETNEFVKEVTIR